MRDALPAQSTTSHVIDKTASDLHLLILDLQDAILTIEIESNVSSLDGLRLEKLLQDLTQHVDKFSRYVRNDESSYSSGTLLKPS